MKKERKNIVQAQNTTTSAAPRVPIFRYIGQEYDRGILLPDNTLVRPAHLTTAEVPEFLQKYPHLAAWFERI